MPEGFNIREAWCSACQAKRRTSDLAGVLLEILAGTGPRFSHLSAAKPLLSGWSIFEAQADGVLHALLRDLPGYVCSEFLDDTPPGTLNDASIRCENLERLSFPDNSFDLVITQDVLEHVSDPWRAFREIDRVLKPGGRHLFTIPVHEGRSTMSRTRAGLGDIVHLLAPVYHGDPLRESGSLVHTDFGGDVTDRLRAMQLNARLAYRGTDYDQRESPWIDGNEEHARYVRARESGRLLDYFRYNSLVYETVKAPAVAGRSTR